MKVKSIILSIGIIVVLAGCTEITTKFVVRRDVPETPSFTVIPFNLYHKQLVFAGQIEEVLIYLGVKTYIRPALKEIITKKGKGDEKFAGRSLGDGDSISELLMSGKTADAITIEEYLSYDDIKSEYIIHADVFSKRIKIIRTKTSEILVSFEVLVGNVNVDAGETKEYKFKKLFHDALEGLGLKIEALPPLPSQPVSYSKGLYGR